jgi:hypothetical protein
MFDQIVARPEAGVSQKQGGADLNHAEVSMLFTRKTAFF